MILPPSPGPNNFVPTASQKIRLGIQSATIMQNSTATDTARREFLKFLAASPYVAALGGVAAYLERNVLAQNTPGTSSVITDPAKALNVFDFEEPLTAESYRDTGRTWRVASTMTALFAPTAKRSSTSNCARAACMTPPKLTCVSIYSAQHITARSIFARQAVRKRSLGRVN